MRVGIPIWGEKISPVLDTATRILVLDVENYTESSRFEIYLDEQDLTRKCYRIRGLSIDIMICGAISRPFSSLLKAAGISIIPGISGQTEDVLEAYLQGDLPRSSKFFMPGTSSKNPLDLAAQFFQGNIAYEIMDIALSDKNIDGLILDIPSFYLIPVFKSLSNRDLRSNMIEGLNLGHKHNKPLIPIIQRLNLPKEREEIQQKLVAKKIPVFGDPLEFIPLLSKISNYKTRALKKK